MKDNISNNMSTELTNMTDEYDELDMKILGFKTTERLDGDWNSLLFEVRNHECDE